MKRNFLFILIILLLPMIVLPIFSAPSGVVMSTTETPTSYSIRIPSTGVRMFLTHEHEDGCACGLGLWNGGRINTHAQIFESVKVGDWAKIHQPEGNLVLECVKITTTIDFSVRPDGDVLICVCDWPFVKVYRFIVL